MTRTRTKRPNTTSRGYGAKWQQARTGYLKSHLWCIACKAIGKATPATDVDHITPHKGDQKLFWNRANWQAVCHSHHSRKTRDEQLNRIRGCDEHGMPLDPNHPWNRRR